MIRIRNETIDHLRWRERRERGLTERRTGRRDVTRPKFVCENKNMRVGCEEATPTGREEGCLEELCALSSAHT